MDNMTYIQPVDWEQWGVIDDVGYNYMFW